MKAGSHCWPAPWCWPCNCKATQPRVLTPARPHRAGRPHAAPLARGPGLARAAALVHRVFRPAPLPLPLLCPAPARPARGRRAGRRRGQAATSATGCMRCCSVFMKTCATSPPTTRASAAPAWTPLPRAVTREQRLQDGDFLPFAAGWAQLRDGYLHWLAGHEQQGAMFREAEVKAQPAAGRPGADRHHRPHRRRFQHRASPRCW